MYPEISVFTYAPPFSTSHRAILFKCVQWCKTPERQPSFCLEKSSLLVRALKRTTSEACLGLLVRKRAIHIKRRACEGWGGDLTREETRSRSCPLNGCLWLYLHWWGTFHNWHLFSIFLFFLCFSSFLKLKITFRVTSLQHLVFSRLTLDSSTIRARIALIHTWKHDFSISFYWF